MTTVGRIIRRLGLYDAIRYSRIYGLMQRIRNPDYVRSQAEDEALYRKLLGCAPADLIFDVGANVGDKAAIFSRLARRVVCFEPDPRLAQHLRKRFRRQPNVLIEACGVSDRSGVASLHSYDGGSAFNTLDARQHEQMSHAHAVHEVIEVPVVTLDAMIATHGLPTFLKVDVEGHEKEVFDGLSARVGLVSFEANLPLFAAETCSVTRRLESLSPAVRFGVGGSGLLMEGDYPMTADELCHMVSSPDAPTFLEVFARL